MAFVHILIGFHLEEILVRAKDAIVFKVPTVTIFGALSGRGGRLIFKQRLSRYSFHTLLEMESEIDKTKGSISRTENKPFLLTDYGKFSTNHEEK